MKFCKFDSHLSLETLLSALKLTKTFFCINLNISFHENWKFNHKLAPPFLQTYQV